MKENRKRYQCPNCGWTSFEELEKEHLEHCPNCLSGIHETDREGNPCGGILEPVSVWIHPCTDSFICKVCGWPVVSAGAGSNHRNHCPNCLYSIHLDNEPGDRESRCHGRMEPIGVWVRKNGEWAIIHRCIKCGKIGSNRVAADDNPMKLMALAMRPFGSSGISRADVREMTATME